MGVEDDHGAERTKRGERGRAGADDYATAGSRLRPLVGLQGDPVAGALEPGSKNKGVTSRGGQYEQVTWLAGPRLDGSLDHRKARRGRGQAEHGRGRRESLERGGDNLLLEAAARSRG
jgi:hypothetical protein